MRHWKIENPSFKRVSHFNYSGSILTNNNNIKIEIATKCKKGSNCYYGLAKWFGKDDQTGEWRRRHNQELVDLFRYPSITKEVSFRRLRWAEHTGRKQGSIVRTVIENNPTEKRPLGIILLPLICGGRTVSSEI